MSVQQAATTTPTAPSLERGTIAGAAVDDDRFLIGKARSGSASAFGELYQRHRIRVYRVSLRILRNAQDAEDALQRSFQRAFTNVGKFRGDSAFATWVTRIAINEALMMLRQRRSEARLVQNSSDGECAIDPADEGPTPEEVLFANERRHMVTEAIDRLRESLRAVIVLRELQGLTNAEIARRLGLTLGAVKARIFHARRYLRRYLEPRFQAARNGFQPKTS